MESYTRNGEQDGELGPKVGKKRFRSAHVPYVAYEVIYFRWKEHISMWHNSCKFITPLPSQNRPLGKTDEPREVTWFVTQIEEVQIKSANRQFDTPLLPEKWCPPPPVSDRRVVENQSKGNQEIFPRRGQKSPRNRQLWSQDCIDSLRQQRQPD